MKHFMVMFNPEAPLLVVGLRTEMTRLHPQKEVPLLRCTAVEWDIHGFVRMTPRTRDPRAVTWTVPIQWIWAVAEAEDEKSQAGFGIPSANA
jgi:hypothetical protein